jgi:hypothetical protein
MSRVTGSSDTKYGSQLRRTTDSPWIWIDPELDTVYLAPALKIGPIRQETLADIKHIAMPHHIRDNPNLFSIDSTLDYLICVPRLESFTVLLHSYLCGNVGDEENNFPALRGWSLEFNAAQDAMSKKHVEAKFAELDSYIKKRRLDDRGYKGVNIAVKRLKINGKACCPFTIQGYKPRLSQTAVMKPKMMQGGC